MGDRAMIERPALRPASQAREGAASTLFDNRPAAVAQRKLMGMVRQAPRVAALAAIGAGINRGARPIQRVVSQANREKDPNKKGKWYSSKDPSATHFATKAEADARELEIETEAAKKKEDEQQAKRQRREANYKAEMDKNFSGYVPPDTGKARLYKGQDKGHDDVDLVSPTPENVKSYSENAFANRRSGTFKTQVMKLGGEHFVLQPGTDIGLTPANLRPDLKATPATHVPLSRDGKAKTYPDIAHSLDKTAIEHAGKTGAPIKETRSRMGKDLDRMTRGNPPAPTHSYAPDQSKQMQELAAVLRLDKGRVPKATKRIRETFTSGDDSFHDLLSNEKYAGAGTGGVERLRGVQSDDGNISEGSDIDERNAKKVKVEADAKLKG